MGMFDYLIYRKKQYQTKDTPSQTLDYYQLRDDNTLWFENYDPEWIDEDSMFGGHISKKNKRWELCEDITDKIRFYRSLGSDEWEEFEATIVKGKVIEIIEV